MPQYTRPGMRGTQYSTQYPLALGVPVRGSSEYCRAPAVKTPRHTRGRTLPYPPHLLYTYKKAAPYTHQHTVSPPGWIRERSSGTISPSPRIIPTLFRRLAIVIGSAQRQLNRDAPPLTCHRCPSQPPHTTTTKQPCARGGHCDLC